MQLFTISSRCLRLFSVVLFWFVVSSFAQAASSEYGGLPVPFQHYGVSVPNMVYGINGPEKVDDKTIWLNCWFNFSGLQAPPDMRLNHFILFYAKIKKDEPSERFVFKEIDKQSDGRRWPKWYNYEILNMSVDLTNGTGSADVWLTNMEPGIYVFYLLPCRSADSYMEIDPFLSRNLPIFDQYIGNRYSADKYPLERYPVELYPDGPLYDYNDMAFYPFYELTSLDYDPNLYIPVGRTGIMAPKIIAAVYAPDYSESLKDVLTIVYNQNDPQYSDLVRDFAYDHYEFTIRVPDRDVMIEPTPSYTSGENYSKESAYSIANFINKMKQSGYSRPRTLDGLVIPIEMRGVEQDGTKSSPSIFNSMQGKLNLPTNIEVGTASIVENKCFFQLNWMDNTENEKYYKVWKSSDGVNYEPATPNPMIQTTPETKGAVISLDVEESKGFPLMSYKIQACNDYPEATSEVTFCVYAGYNTADWDAPPQLYITPAPAPHLDKANGFYDIPSKSFNTELIINLSDMYSERFLINTDHQLEVIKKVLVFRQRGVSPTWSLVKSMDVSALNVVDKRVPLTIIDNGNFEDGSSETLNPSRDYKYCVYTVSEFESLSNGNVVKSESWSDAREITVKMPDQPVNPDLSVYSDDYNQYLRIQVGGTDGFKQLITRIELWRTDSDGTSQMVGSSLYDINGSQIFDFSFPKGDSCTFTAYCVSNKIPNGTMLPDGTYSEIYSAGDSEEITGQ